MIRYWLLIILLLFAVAVSSAVANDNKQLDEISAKVTQLAEMLSDGYAEEVKENRGIQIFSPKGFAELAVAIFTVGGFAMGNNATQYMAVFTVLSEESQGHPQRFSLLDVMAVGGKGWRSVDHKKVKLIKEKDRIVVSLNTFEYSPKDAICCPSRKSTAKYSITTTTGGRLKELRNK